MVAGETIGNRQWAMGNERSRKITKTDLEAGADSSKSFINSAHIMTTIGAALAVVILGLLLRYFVNKKNQTRTRHLNLYR